MEAGGAEGIQVRGSHRLNGGEIGGGGGEKRAVGGIGGRLENGRANGTLKGHGKEEIGGK